MIESAQDKHIRELEAEVRRLGNFNCELDREVENLKEHLAAARRNIGELEGSLAATDKLLADIQHRVAQLENHTAAPWPHPPVYDASAVIKSFQTNTVDELHKRIADLEKELAAAHAEIDQLSYDRDTLAKRLADICNIAKKDT